MEKLKSELPLPDVRAMLEFEELGGDIYYSDTAQVLPAVRERLLDLVNLLKQGNDALRQKVLDGLVSLNIDLEGIEEEGAAALDEEELARIRAQLQREMKGVERSVELLRAYRKPALGALKQSAQNDVESRKSLVQQAEQKVTELKVRLEEVDSALALLNTPSVRKALKNLVPENKDIDTVLSTIKDPTLSPELLKAGLAKLNEGLDLLEQGREFANVLAARDRLAEQLKEAQESLPELVEFLKVAEKNLRQYERVDVLLALREQWLAQIDLYISSWTSLERKMGASMEPNTLLSALKAARSYLLAIRRCFEAA